MAQFRTSADLVSSVLRRCGENQDSTSNYYQQAIDYLNQIHHTVITGGSEFNLEVDEPWVWASARRPIVLEIQPAHTTGSVTLTQGSESGTFSSAPSSSLEGYYLKLNNGPEVYRIAQHTAASAAFELDAAFPQTTVTGQTFLALKLEYDLSDSYIVIDSSNDKLDFIESGTTVLTGTLVHGSYLPADLATAVAVALNAAGTHSNTYSASYDSLRKLFSATSALNGTGTPIFKPQGAGTNYYRSAWDTLGYDFENLTSAATQTAVYSLSAVTRLVQPARCYYVDGRNAGQQGIIPAVDQLILDRDYPLSRLVSGVPTAYAAVAEYPNGAHTVRFNKYPDRKMRVEFEYIPVPKDLKDSSASIPLIPRKFIRVLEYGAAFYILTDKRDSKAQTYFQIAQQTLQAMKKFNFNELKNTGRNYGNVIARRDLMCDRDRNPLYGYDKDVI